MDTEPHLYDLNDTAFRSVVKAFYFRAWRDFESFALVELRLSDAELRFALNRFLSGQVHRRDRRNYYEELNLTLTTIYRQALEDIHYRSGIENGFVTVPIMVQRTSVELLKESIVKLNLDRQTA